MSTFNPLSCPICKSSLKHPICLDCGHCFCSECVELLNKKQCPICKYIITDKQYPTVFNLMPPTDDYLYELDSSIDEKEKIIFTPLKI